jgi:hypothetical protein
VFEVGLSPDRRVSVRLIEGVIDVKLPAANRAQHGAVKRLHGSGALTFAAGSAPQLTPIHHDRGNSHSSSSLKMLPKRIFRSQADGADSFRHCGAFDSNHVLAPRCREREPSTHLLSTDSCRKRMAAFDPKLPLA